MKDYSSSDGRAVWVVDPAFLSVIEGTKPVKASNLATLDTRIYTHTHAQTHTSALARWWVRFFSPVTEHRAAAAAAGLEPVSRLPDG